MNVIRTISAPERRSLKRLNQTDAGVDKNAEEIVKIKSDKPTAIQTNLIDNLF